MALDRKFPQSHKTWPLTKVTAQTASRTTNFALSGDPVVCGQVPGVALGNADANGRCVMQTDGIFNLLVAGIDSSGTSAADANVAVNGGDIVYFNKDNTPPLSKRAGGIRFGYVVGDVGVAAIASGVTNKTCLVQVGY